MNCVIRRIVSSSLRVEELQAFINRGRAIGKQGQRIDTDLCAQREKTLQKHDTFHAFPITPQNNLKIYLN